MIYTRGWTPDRWAVEVSFFAPDHEYPWWRAKVQVWRWWWSWERFLRRDIVGIRQRERGR